LGKGVTYAILWQRPRDRTVRARNKELTWEINAWSQWVNQQKQ